MDTPLKRSVLESLRKQEDASDSVLLSAAKNPANCDAETSIVEIPPTPLFRTLGFGTGVRVMCINRSQPTDENPRSPWAIKMLSARTETTDKATIDARLLKEAKILRTLSHPSIVGYRGFDELEAGRRFLALEYCTSTLGNILEQRYDNNEGPLEAAKAKRMMFDVLGGLDYLHTVAFVLHGDMKSFNILINKDFLSAKICDFGVSLKLKEDGFVDLEKYPDARYVGTAIWSAPEALASDQSLVCSKTDIFSFGLVIYETVTLVPPHTFPGIKDEKIVNSAGYASLRAKVDAPDAKRQLDLSGSVIEILDDTDMAENITVSTARAHKRKFNPEQEEKQKKLSRGRPLTPYAVACDPYFFDKSPKLSPAPAPASAAAPESPSAAAPESPSAAAPEFPSAAAPESPSAAAPGPASTTIPAPDSATTPASDSAAAPEPASAPAREPASATTPASDSAAAPASDSAAAPEPASAAAPASDSVVAPEPASAAAPAPDSAAAPAPDSAAAPAPDSAAAPAPDSAAAPVPASATTEPAVNNANISEPDSSTEKHGKEAEPILIIDDGSPPIATVPASTGPDVEGEIISISSSTSDECDDFDDPEEYPIDVDDEFVEEEGYYDEDYDEDGEGYDEYGEGYGEDEEGMDEIVDEEEEDEDDGPYLNYGVLGSRPPIPTNIAIDAEHMELLEMFSVCTEADPSSRPTARQLLDALAKTMGRDGQPANQPEPDEASTGAAKQEEQPKSDDPGEKDRTNANPPSD